MSHSTYNENAEVLPPIISLQKKGSALHWTIVLLSRSLSLSTTLVQQQRRPRDTTWFQHRQRLVPVVGAAQEGVEEPYDLRLYVGDGVVFLVVIVVGGVVAIGGGCGAEDNADG